MWEARSQGRAGPGRAGAWAAARGVGAAREGPTPQPDEGERRRVGELGNRKRFMRREWWSRARQEGAGTANSGSGPFAARGGPRGASSERPVVGSRPRRAPSPCWQPWPRGESRSAAGQSLPARASFGQVTAEPGEAPPLFLGTPRFLHAGTPGSQCPASESCVDGSRCPAFLLLGQRLRGH